MLLGVLPHHSYQGIRFAHAVVIAYPFGMLFPYARGECEEASTGVVWPSHFELENLLGVKATLHSEENAAAFCLDPQILPAIRQTARRHHPSWQKGGEKPMAIYTKIRCMRCRSRPNSRATTGSLRP